VQVAQIHLEEANEFVSRHHRHSQRTVGRKFAIGVEHDGKLVGVAIAGPWLDGSTTARAWKCSN